VTGIEYRVLPPDVITIQSRHVPEIDGVTQRIDPAGKINLPLMGEIYVAGKTPNEIEAALNEAASEYYERVDATVTVSEYLSQKFYVFGQVTRPGPMPWTGCDTLLDVLALAQPNELAWPERIIVLRAPEPKRGGFATTQPYWDTRTYRKTGVHPESQIRPRKKMTVNLMAMIQHGDLANNVLLMPNDIIYVQPYPTAKFGLFLRKLLFPASPVLETARIPYTIQYSVEPAGADRD